MQPLARISYGPMRWMIALLFACALAGFAERKSDREIEAYLDGMQAPSKRYNNVEPAEGAYLRDLVRKLKAKRVLEIGTSTGYSGIWMALGLRETGGRLLSIEYNQARHSAAVANFAATGLAKSSMRA
jgi:predicted O-methyltransferase YrrM